MRYLLLVGLLSLGCQAPPDGVGGQNVDEPDPQLPDPQERVAEVNFAGSEEALAAKEFTTDFTLLGTRDIHIVFDFPMEGGTELVQIAILNSDGHIYKSYWRAYAANPAEGSTVTPEGTEKKVRVHTVERDAEGWGSATLTLPIAGTKFTKHRLTGDFTVQVIHEEAGKSPIATRSFELSRGELKVAP